jgi:hypothetical protein
MATVSRGLPPQPHIDVPKREARELLALWRAANPDAFERIRCRVDKFRDLSDAALARVDFKLADAQLTIAREYGFAHWTALKQRIDANEPAERLLQLIRANDRDGAVTLLREHPVLLHIPLWGGNWGPPMSHAANLGRLEIVQAIAALGARDFQHAFERALLQGKIETARWLFTQGAQLVPDIVMGSCECLDPDGLRLLVELKAPFMDKHGNRLAPLALVLETYARNPVDKHPVLEIFAAQGYDLPDTPIMAFHRGQVDRLRDHLQRDPSLLHRRFALTDIYPPALGCAADGRSGMHGTPIDGGTLLHLAIDFDEQAIFDLLLAQGADVNARTSVDAEGFGGHTPLFNAILGSTYSSHGRRDGAMAKALLERGADVTLRANLRKFLDWVEEPRWHIARDVTALEWAKGFPFQDWVNADAKRWVEGG